MILLVCDNAAKLLAITLSWIWANEKPYLLAYSSPAYIWGRGVAWPSFRLWEPVTPVQIRAAPLLYINITFHLSPINIYHFIFTNS